MTVAPSAEDPAGAATWPAGRVIGWVVGLVVLAAAMLAGARDHPAGAHQSAATPGATDPGASRAEPAPLGAEIQGNERAITVLEVVTGDQALSALRGTSFSPDEVVPLPGQEFVLVRVRVRNLAADGSTVYPSGYDFGLTASANVIYETDFLDVTPPQPRLQGSLQPGQEAEGWVALTVGIGETDLELVYFGASAEDAGGYRYLALEEDASLPVEDPPVEPLVPVGTLPNEAGLRRLEPAPPGEIAVTDKLAVQVVDLLRGEDALARIREGDPDADGPKPGNEYVLFRVRVSAVPSQGTVYVQSYQFAATGSRNLRHSSTSFSADPELSYFIRLFPGGTWEAWLPVELAADQTDLRLIYEPIGTPPRYLAAEVGADDGEEDDQTEDGAADGDTSDEETDPTPPSEGPQTGANTAATGGETAEDDAEDGDGADEGEGGSDVNSGVPG